MFCLLQVTASIAVKVKGGTPLDTRVASSGARRLQKGLLIGVSNTMSACWNVLEDYSFGCDIDKKGLLS